MGENDQKISETRFPDKWKYLNKKSATPHEYFNNTNDYQKHVDSLKKEDFFSKFKKVILMIKKKNERRNLLKNLILKMEKNYQKYIQKVTYFCLHVFEKFIKVSVIEYGINPLYCVSLPGYTWQCGLKYIGINLQRLPDKDMILLLENNIRGGISSVMGDRYVKSDESKKILYKDANNLYGWAMSEYLPYDVIKFDNNVNLEDILNTPDDNDIGYFFEVDLKYPNNIKEKIKRFPFAPGKKIS